MRPGGPRFDLSVARGGYAWWYVDALSEDERHGITLIAFIGSVFSPYYAWARRSGNPDPRDHCSLNVALYGASARRWAMTERTRSRLYQSPATLGIGPSQLSWDGETLTIRIDETASPLPTRVQGVVRVCPAAVTARDFALDPAGHHRWWPIAPRSHVEVAFERPALHWSGTGYFDMNSGSEPLERGFQRWDWSRAALSDGTAILYDTEPRHGAGAALALRIDARGEIEELEAPPRVPLPASRIWRIVRGTRCEPEYRARVAHTLEDTPFYVRSLVNTRLLGSDTTAMHESLCLDRFRSPWVQAMLPFRMPRVAWGSDNADAGRR